MMMPISPAFMHISSKPDAMVPAQTEDSCASHSSESLVTAKPPSRWRVMIPLLLLAVYVIQGVWFIRTQSFTWDEPLHLQAGLEEWRLGSFRLVSDHPPLGHLLPTALIARDPNVRLHFLIVPWLSMDLLSADPDPEFVARHTRPLVLALGLLLGVLLWKTARSLFSEGAANLALALFAFSPNLIAHFSMVTTDGVLTIAYFATGVQLMRWRKNPSWPQTALLGILLGVLLLSKLSAPVLVMLALLFVLVKRRKEWHSLRDWRWRPAFLAFALGLFVLWAGYFFHVSHLTTQQGTLFMNFPPVQKSVPVWIVMVRKINLWVPAGEYVYGFLQTIEHNSAGHGKFLLGSATTGYMPLLYPTIVALKWPPIVLLLFVCSIVLFATRKIKLPPGWVVLAVFPLAVLLLAMSSRIASGERHLLPAYPFVLLFASATWDYARALGKRVRVALLLVAVAANAADVLRYAPDYLSYFNPLVRQTESYRLLSFSDLDWGQGLLALKKYQGEHPSENIYLATVGNTTPAAYGIRATQLEPGQRPSGTIVISATRLAGFRAGGPCGFCWVQKYPLKTTLNHSLFVYEVPPNPER